MKFRITSPRAPLPRGEANTSPAILSTQYWQNLLRPVSSIPVGFTACISDDSFMLDAHVTPMHIMTLSTLCTTLLPHPFTQVCRTQGHCRYPMKGALMASPCSLTPSGFQTSSSSCFAVDFTYTPVFSTVKAVFHLAFSADRKSVV